MDLQIPLNRLKFGHEDGEGINARVTGRDDGIAALAANLNANGQIENLIVKDAGSGFYSVANGNRRLAAFHMMLGADSDEPIGCTLHEIDQEKALEFSLITAVTAKQLHPVDQFEAFSHLAEKGKTEEEIASQYGMTSREVQQALALGHLSPTVRSAWRKGELKTEAAQAFTLAADHKTQDDVFAALTAGGRGDIDHWDVKRTLKISHDECGKLVEFVGFEAYAARGGKATRDLFGTDHQVSDAKLVKKMASEKLAEECEKLKVAGWSFAVASDSVRNTRHDFTRLKVDAAATEDELEHLAALGCIFSKGEVAEGSYHADTYAELTGPEQQAYLDYRALISSINLRAYTPKMMEKAGCFVGVDDDGFLDVEYGYVKPAKKEAAAEVVKAEKKEQKKTTAKTAAAEGKPAPESTVLSNALKERLEMALVGATRDAIAGEPLLVNSPLFDVLARVVCAQITVNRAWGTPDAVRTKLPSIRQTLNPDVFNVAIAKRFDAEDYFSSAPKGLVVKAIAEAINADEARKASVGKTKADIAKFALTNLGKSGWLPKELRTVHYSGPGSEGYVAVAHAGAVVATASRPPAAPATTADKVKADKADRETKRNSVVMKRAAAAKKTAKKTSKKKR